MPLGPWLFSSLSVGVGIGSTVNGAAATTPLQEAVTLCATDAAAVAGTSKVTVEASAPLGEVGNGPSSHCHDTVCELFDPSPRQASSPVAVAVTDFCPGVPWPGKSVRRGCGVTVNVAEPVLFPAAVSHDALT
jgi:hypothetical protein